MSKQENYRRHFKADKKADYITGGRAVVAHVRLTSGISYVLRNPVRSWPA